MGHVAVRPATTSEIKCVVKTNSQKLFLMGLAAVLKAIQQRLTCAAMGCCRLSNQMEPAAVRRLIMRQLGVVAMVNYCQIHFALHSPHHLIQRRQIMKRVLIQGIILHLGGGQQRLGGGLPLIDGTLRPGTHGGQPPRIRGGRPQRLDGTRRPKTRGGPAPHRTRGGHPSLQHLTGLLTPRPEIRGTRQPVIPNGGQILLKIGQQPLTIQFGLPQPIIHFGQQSPKTLGGPQPHMGLMIPLPIILG